MAIAFGRLQFIKRSKGKNACMKAAYIAREKINFEGTKFQPQAVYDFSWKGNVIYNEVLLPSHVDEKFKNIETLWNLVEATENRKDSQLAVDLVLALPDDSIISDQDRIEMSREFAQRYLVDKGLAVQISIHPPDGRKELIEETDELEERSHNSHVHFQATIRRFDQSGKAFQKTKPLDLFPQGGKGRGLAEIRWGVEWGNFQNAFFKQKGYDLKVNSTAIVPQRHIGPVRMRSRAYDLIEQNDRAVEANIKACSNPLAILKKIESEKTLFRREDIDSFVSRYVDPKKSVDVLTKFFSQKQVVPLLNPETKGPTEYFTTTRILQEERSFLRIAESICERSSLEVKKIDPAFVEKLNEEQTRAFRGIVSGKALSCVQGFAGTGKSHLLISLKKTYEGQGYTVRAFGPDSATVSVLEEKGFTNAENTHKFLFHLKGGNRSISSGKEVWLLDESGKLGTEPLLELLKEANRHRVQIVLSGDIAQHSPVGRGDPFKTLCKVFGFESLEDIQRQQTDKQREIAKNLAKGEIASALDALSQSGNIRWSTTRKSAMEDLVGSWAAENRDLSRDLSLIIAGSNKEVKVLNEYVRDVRKARGELPGDDLEIETFRGKVFVGRGDLIEFRKIDRQLGVSNGRVGTILEAKPNKFIVRLSDHKDIEFNPEKYSNWQLGYASTNYRSQGRTVTKAYVLHSWMMNKLGLYVGLTRHTTDVKLFVSQETARSMMHLKNQLVRDDETPSLLNFITQADVEQEKRYLETEELKQSDLLSQRLRGYARLAWEFVNESKTQVKEAFTDRNRSKEFYQVDSVPNLPQVTGYSKPEKEQLPEEPPTENPVKKQHSKAKTTRTIEDRREETATLEKELKGRMQELAYHLIGERPTGRSGGSLRFGTKGSLSINVSGSHQGTFKDFENGKSGGPLQLIQHLKGCDFKEACSFARDFSGISGIAVPETYRPQSTKESNWHSVKPPKGKEAPPATIPGYHEVMRHSYRDLNGDLLFYTVRLEGESKSKLVLPLTYGYENDKNESQWKLKGWQGERPIYNQHLFSQRKTAPVLIVEGEKTADAANKLLGNNYICVTWMGGAGAVLKTNWSLLSEREVFIWPDNDKPGFDAAKQLSSELRKVGAASIKSVDENALREFPKSWDLADELPEKKTLKNIEKTLLLAPNRAVDPRRLMIQLKLEERSPEAARVKDILHRVDERLRDNLESSKGVEAANKQIHNEALQICSKWETTLKDLGCEYGAKGEHLERLGTICLQREAEKGVFPSRVEIDRFRNDLKNGKDLHQTTLLAKEEIQKDMDRSLEQPSPGGFFNTMKNANQKEFDKARDRGLER